MKNKLQYLYSIIVFMGVLVTTYMMMNHDGSSRAPYQQALQPSVLRSEGMVDPAVNSLFEMEDALSRLRKDKGGDDLRRAPTQTPQLVPTIKR